MKTEFYSGKLSTHPIYNLIENTNVSGQMFFFEAFYLTRWKCFKIMRKYKNIFHYDKSFNIQAIRLDVLSQMIENLEYMYQQIEQFILAPPTPDQLQQLATTGMLGFQIPDPAKAKAAPTKESKTFEFLNECQTYVGVIRGLTNGKPTLETCKHLQYTNTRALKRFQKCVIDAKNRINQLEKEATAEVEVPMCGTIVCTNMVCKAYSAILKSLLAQVPIQFDTMMLNIVGDSDLSMMDFKNFLEEWS